jgi:hypothetical protein
MLPPTNVCRHKTETCRILVTVPACLEILLLGSTPQAWVQKIRYVILDEVRRCLLMPMLSCRMLLVLLLLLPLLLPPSLVFQQRKRSTVYQCHCQWSGGPQHQHPCLPRAAPPAGALHAGGQPGGGRQPGRIRQALRHCTALRACGPPACLVARMLDCAPESAW